MKRLYEWKVATVLHEGVPLALRVRIGAGTLEQRSTYGRLAIVVQTLEHARPNGLPDTAYNESLADLDAEVIECLEANKQGLVVLVETFDGERSYYAYAAAGGLANRVVAELAARYPQHILKAYEKPDPEWSLLEEYRSKWPW